MESASYPKEEAMEASVPAINWVRIDQADNGFTVSWDEKEQKDTMEHCEYISHTELFSMEEADKAWAKFRSLKEKEWAYEKKMRAIH